LEGTVELSCTTGISGGIRGEKVSIGCEGEARKEKECECEKNEGR